MGKGTTVGAEDSQDAARARIVAAAVDLLAEGGRDALTTRAVAAAAGVQAPTIYRIFGDKGGLLDAVAEHGLEKFLAKKRARAPHPDPLDDLRAGWDFTVAFGLAHPAIFAIMNEPRPGKALSPATVAGLEILKQRIHRLATAGLLKVSEERAVGLVRVSGIGTVVTLLSLPERQRDPGLAAAARESVIAAICAPAAVVEGPPLVGAAITLRASLDEAAALTPGERHLLAELLDRLARRP